MATDNALFPQINLFLLRQLCQSLQQKGNPFQF